MKPKILLIDDEEMFLKITTPLLIMAGAEIIEASSGQRGLATWRLLRGQLDLVVCDIRMSGEIQGPEVIKAIKAEAKSTPILAYTGNEHKAQDCGADRIIQKPDTMGLMEAVNDLLPSGKRLVYPSAGRKNTVLIVDSSKDRRQLFAAACKKVSNSFFVLAVDSGQEALDIWRSRNGQGLSVKNQICLVVASHRLPDMMGSEVFMAMTADRPELPALFSTSSAINQLAANPQEQAEKIEATMREHLADFL